MSVVLVINSGSSSLKYSLIDTATEVPLASGLIERIGQPLSVIREIRDDIDSRVRTLLAELIGPSVT